MIGRLEGLTSPVNKARDMLVLPTEVLWYIWAFLRVQDVLRFSCCSHGCSEAVGFFLAHAGNVLVVYRSLSDAELLSLVRKLPRVNMLGIVCGMRQVGYPGFSFSENHTLTFEGIEKMLDVLPPRALVDINGGNCYLGNIENLFHMFERRPGLLTHLANLHILPGMPKEIVLPLLHHCSNLRALLLDHCIVGSANTVIEFPNMQHLTLRGVSFAFSRSLFVLLSSCGNCLLTFEMTGCIAFQDDELDALVRQRGLQLMTLKQRCTLSDIFIAESRWDSLKILCIDSVQPYTGVGKIISSSPLLQVLEVHELACDELFFSLKTGNMVNSNLEKLVLKNSTPLQSTFSNAGLEWALDAFPNTKILTLHLLGPSFIPVMRNLRELFLVDIAVDFQLIEKITHNDVFLEKLYCKSLQITPGMATHLTIESKSLSTAIFKNCFIEQINIGYAPNLTRFVLSRLRSSTLRCFVSGSCALKVLQLSKVSQAIIDSFLYSIVCSSNLFSKWLKVKCRHCSPTSQVLEEVCSKFCGNVLFISRPPFSKLNRVIKCILNNLRYLMDKTREVVGHRGETQSVSRFSLPNNIHLMGNFPIEPLTCRSPVNIHFPVRERSLTIITDYAL